LLQTKRDRETCEMQPHIKQHWFNQHTKS
jgi:hypothetical protein